MKYIKEISIFLLIFMSTMLISTSLLFLCKISISSINLPLSFLLTGIIYFIINRYDKKQVLKIILLSLGIIVMSTLISSYMFDRSSDGNTYHKDAIGVLKEGYNPVYESSYNFIVKRKDDSKTLTDYSIWTDHYAKANWIIAADFYSLTDNIESGKAMNIISIVIVFGFILTSLEFIGKKKALLISLITVINPITASQMFTYYNDQLVCLYLFLIVLFLIKLDKDVNDKKTWFYYILTFTILANMKFNGLGYLLVFSFLFVCRYLYKAYKNRNLLKILKKLLLIFIPLFIVSLIIVGYPTYVKNTIDHSNPFFPLYDKNGEDIITKQQPKKFLKMNNIEKLFYGTFSKANNLRDNDNTDLKVPFLVSKNELKPAMSNDLRISGWGVLFSGLLIVSLIVLVIYYKKYKHENFIIYTLGITTILLIVMSESWWARYTPHFYLFIILSLYILYKYGKSKLVNITITSLVIINTLIPLLGNSYYTLKNSREIINDFNTLKNSTISLNVNGMNGIIYNLKDYKINYKLDKTISGNELYYHYLNYDKISK